ncbi:hypothetical protein RUND412_002022 [Rhizina undulata]
MCRYTRVIYVCGHPKYFLHLTCPQCYNNALNISPCQLILIRGVPRWENIHTTIARNNETCGDSECGYDPSEDPFIPRRMKIFVNGGPGGSSASASADLRGKGEVREVRGSHGCSGECGESMSLDSPGTSVGKSMRKLRIASSRERLF